MSAHTRGPWTTFNSYADTLPDRSPDQIRSPDGDVVAWTPASVAANAAANARLIAAAPDLLEAAITALAYLEMNAPPDGRDGSFYTESVRELTNAIEKTRVP